MRNRPIVRNITSKEDNSLNIYFKDILKRKPLTLEEEVKLFKKIKKGDKKAEAKLIESNLRFVVSIAKQYQNKGIPLVDLIQEGNLGLLQASRKFNESYGYKFISYAVWWIRQSITKFIYENYRTVKTPTNQIVYIGKINKAIERFEQLNERQPSISELSEFMELDFDKIDNALSSVTKSISIETPVGPEEDTCLVNILSDKSTSVDEIVSNKELQEIVDNILNKLSHRDSDIIRMYFGIGVHKMEYEEISAKFGITAERVRQLLHNILEYIKEKYGEKLVDLL